MNNSLIKTKKKNVARGVPETFSGQKNIQDARQVTAQEYEAFQLMKNELKSKDLVIQNLRDRLMNLEEKVIGIQQQQ